MSIDRPARDRLAQTLAAYMRGEVDNRDLERVILDAKTEDRAVRYLGWRLWFMYDDLKSHPISVSWEGWEVLRRTLAFLLSDLPWPETPRDVRRWLHRGQPIPAAVLPVLILAAWSADRALYLPVLWVGIGFCTAVGYARVERRDRRRAVSNPDRPFKDHTAWLAHEPLLAGLNLPAYDPVRHGAPIRNGALERVHFIGWMLLAGPIVLFLWFLPRWERTS